MLVDKPAGITSHDVVAIVRRATKQRAASATPERSIRSRPDLLVVLVGRGTRLDPVRRRRAKGVRGDDPLRHRNRHRRSDRRGRRESASPSDAGIAAAIARLTGEIEQVPPAYSAKQVEGTRAYDAARQGTPLELAPVRVVVHGWTIIGRDGDELRARITCGAGTYIRALARDLGRLTNSAAHLAELRRDRTGSFAIADAASVADLKAGEFELAPLRAAIPSIPTRTLDPDELGRVSHGNAIDARGCSVSRGVAR